MQPDALRGIRLLLNSPSVNTDNDNEHYETLVQRQVKAAENYETLRNYNSIQLGSTVAV